MVVISIMFIKSEEPTTQKLITDYIQMSTVLIESVKPII